MHHNFILINVFCVFLTLITIYNLIKDYKNKNTDACIIDSFILGVQFMCWYEIIKLYF